MSEGPSVHELWEENEILKDQRLADQMKIDYLNAAIVRHEQRFAKDAIELAKLVVDKEELATANARLSSLLAATAGECAAWRNVPDLMTKSEGGCDDSTNYAVTMQCKCESCKVTLPALQATDAALLAVGTTLAELAGCE